jgi:hypothetical protein
MYISHLGTDRSRRYSVHTAVAVDELLGTSFERHRRGLGERNRAFSECNASYGMLRLYLSVGIQFT